MDPFYNQQQQQYPPQHGGGQHFPNNNASHNYFMQQQQQQQHFLHQNANLLPDQQEQPSHQTGPYHNSSEGSFQSTQSPYRPLYQPPVPALDNQHTPLLVPKVEVEEQPPSPPPHPPTYGTPPAGEHQHAATSGDHQHLPVTTTTSKDSHNNNNNNDSYQCSICYESFPTAKTYKGHMANHKIPMTTYSNEAHASSPADVHLLREHILAHVRDHQQFQQLTGSSGPTAALAAAGGSQAGECNLIEKCQYCYKLFADRVQLQVHLKEHNSLKEYKCLNCNKMYASLNYLKLHYKMHADLKPYKCQYCDKRFTFSSNLYVHHRIHTGHKPYRCEKCSKCFSQINSLKQHHRIHRDQGPAPSAGSVLAGGAIPLPTPPPPAVLLNPSGLVGGGAVGLLASSLLPPMMAQQQHQQLQQHHPHTLQQQQQHQQQQLSPLQHGKSQKVLKNEFTGEGDDDDDAELNHTINSTEDKVLNMSSRPPNPGELSIQDVILQQLQQRLVSQP